VERNAFDEMVKRFGVGASRRQLLGGLIGSAAAALAGVTLGSDTAFAAKKGGKGKSKGKGKGVEKPVGPGNGIGQGNGGGNAGGNGNGNGNGGSGPSKVSFCHKNEETGEYEFITVAKPAANIHGNKHNDLECANVPPCMVGTCNVSEGGDVTCGSESIECGEGLTCNPVTGACEASPAP
jgi:hypothetical protein